MTRLLLRTAKVRARIVNHAPLALLTHAYELFLSAALVVIGLALVIQEARPGSVTSQVPHWMVAIWAWSILFGGTATMVAVFLHRPRMEWLGVMATGYGCGFYSLALFFGVSFAQGATSGVIFAGLAGVSFWRAFKITSQSLIQERLAKETTAALLRVQARHIRSLGKADQ